MKTLALTLTPAKRIALISAAALAASAAAMGIQPVGAAGTDVTFALSGENAVAISAPASATLTTEGTSLLALGGTAVSGSLGQITVVDDRGLLFGGWTVTAASTDFVTSQDLTGDGDTDDTGETYAIPATGTLYTQGLLTNVTGLIVPVGTPQTDISGDGKTVVTAPAVLGANSLTFSPTLDVTIPEGAVAGTYTGTVTHSTTGTTS